MVGQYYSMMNGWTEKQRWRRCGCRNKSFMLLPKDKTIACFRWRDFARMTNDSRASSLSLVAPTVISVGITPASEQRIIGCEPDRMGKLLRYLRPSTQPGYQEMWNGRCRRLLEECYLNFL